jgi:hypothetical protein
MLISIVFAIIFSGIKGEVDFPKEMRALLVLEYY